VADVRYTGGARMLLLIECGTGRWRVKVPVLVSELDLECKMWIKLRLAPMCPYVGTLSLAFVGPPTIKVQLAPYSRVRLMRIPLLQPFLAKLLTVDLPALMTLPRRLEINIPPAVTAVAEAAVGRDAVMRAVATAVLQADALEHALLAALPLGPQGAAGGVSLPDLFAGELQVTLRAARDLPVWGFPWQSNPYARVALGAQAVASRRDSETSTPSRHRAPVWNQEFQFLVQDAAAQELEVRILDSPITGRAEVGTARLALARLPREGALEAWLPVESSMPGEAAQGAVLVSVAYRAFSDDDADSGYREAAAYAAMVGSQDGAGQITDVKSAADASSRAAVAASAAAAAVAVTKAAAARAAARLVRGKRPAAVAAAAAAEAEAEAEAQAGGDLTGGGNAAPTSNLEMRLLPGPGPGEAEAAVALAAGPGANGTGPAAVKVKRLAGPDDPVGQRVAVEQLEQMAATMQLLTDEVHALNAHRGAPGADAAAAEAAARAVAAAEALAVRAVAAGDVAGANAALQRAAAALEDTVVQFATADSGPASVSRIILPARVSRDSAYPASGTATPEERAAQALAAAQAAAAAAAAAVEAASAQPRAAEDEAGAVDAGLPSSDDDLEAALAPDAFPSAAQLRAAAAAAAAEAGELSDSDGASDGEGASASQQGGSWWGAALRLLPGVRAPADGAADAAADADGGAAAAPGAGASSLPARSNESEEHHGGQSQQSWWGKAASLLPWGGRGGGADAGVPPPPPPPRRASDGPEPLGDIIMSPDLPLEEIAAEVQKSWKLRDLHQRELVTRALEGSQRQSERPWLVLLSVMATSSAVLLAIVLYRLTNGS
jgi:hypothetical protein